MNRLAWAGMIGAVGMVAQLIIGFALARDATLFDALILPHMLIGITGLVLVTYLLSQAYFTGSIGLKLLYTITFVLVVVQAALGFRILAVPDQQLVMSHEGNAVAVLILLGLSGLISSRGRRKRAVAPSQA